MPDPYPQPWIASALELVDLRREDRVLVVGLDQRAHLSGIRRAVGSDGTVLVVEPRASAARELAEHCEVDVIVRRPTGDERFGTFDAAIATTMTNQDQALTVWSRLVTRNLRPGGRFVIDLPGEVLCEDLVTAWSAIGGDDDALRPLRGPAEAVLADVLRQAGLRRVEVVLGTHLVRLDGPLALARLGWDLMAIGDAPTTRREDLGLALVQRLGTTGPLEIVFKRTCVHGIR